MESYAVFEKDLGAKPTLAAIEKFCFDARTKGAGDKTRTNISSSYDYSQFTVKIPEADLTTPYAAKQAAVPSGKRGIPTWAWGILLVLAIVIGLFV